MKAKTFENPLLSHARMRGLYRGLVEVRALKLVPRATEACHVAAAIGLDEGDIVFATRSRSAAGYVRALGTRKGRGAPGARDLKRASELKAQDEQAFAGTAADGLLCAAGAAMACNPGERVVLALVESDGASQAACVRALQVSGTADLPLVIVALPKAKAGGLDWSAAGQLSAIPVIPVDAADAVALYRVAQEAIGRARADRRSALIECVAGGSDPVKLMGAQLVAKRIADQSWIRSVDAGFRELMATAHGR